MKTTIRWLAVCACGVAMGGCVAIPCGTQTFTTEYPTDIRMTDEKPTKKYKPFVAAKTVQARGVEVGLAGAVAVTQPREQCHERVSLVKKKYLSFGLTPNFGTIWTHDKNGFSRVDFPYRGNGIYSSWSLENPPAEKPHGSISAWEFGVGNTRNKAFAKALLGWLYTPFSILFGAFGPFDSDRHVTGRFLSVENNHRKHLARDVELLLKFPPADRKRIGAWTYHEDAEHPHNTFRNGFDGFSWFGFYKWSQYAMQDPVPLPGTPAPPMVFTNRVQAKGPYGVFLQIPEVGFAKTVEIPRGETRAYFDLRGVASGQETTHATIRFLPPSGGFAEAWDDDVRAMLKLVAGKDLPLVVELPPPRLE